jgi:hypothetical protein
LIGFFQVQEEGGLFVSVKPVMQIGIMVAPDVIENGHNLRKKDLWYIYLRWNEKYLQPNGRVHFHTLEETLKEIEKFGSEITTYGRTRTMKKLTGIVAVAFTTGLIGGSG